MARTINGGTTPEHGKGDNFASRRNPFPLKQANNSAPNFDEIQGLGAALDAVLGAGCAILLGRTRDGGAVVLTVLDGEQRHRTYAGTTDELDAAIIALHNTYVD
jgi:hypothetical protein